MTSIPRVSAQRQTLSQHGVLFLIREEGIRLKPYYDSRHLVTVAVGHLVTPAHREITAADVRRYTFHTTADAVRFFRKVDLPKYEQAVRRALGDTRVSHAEFDMCVSLCFNIGTAGFAGSSVARFLRRGNRKAAANAFLNWSTPPVLRPRRLRERHRFSVAHY